MSRGVSFSYTHRIFFEILLNQTEISLFLPFFRLIWNSKQMSVWFQINRKMVNTIWFLFDLTRFRKDFSVCTTNNGPNIPVVGLDKHQRSGVELFVRLSSFSTLRTPPLKPHGPSQNFRIEGLKGTPQLGPQYAERRQSLGQRMWILQV